MRENKHENCDGAPDGGHTKKCVEWEMDEQERQSEISLSKKDLADLQAKYDSMNKGIPPLFWEELQAKDEAMEKLAASQIEQQRKFSNTLKQQYDRISELEAMIERLHNYLLGIEKTTWPHDAL